MKHSKLLLVVSTLIPLAAGAGRNGSGTYSLPNGNPVVSGTTVSSTWANNTLSDIGNELSGSLSRSGYGGMLAPLQCSDGNQGAPGVGFTNEPASGLYRNATGDVRVSVRGAWIQSWLATGSNISTGLTVTQGQLNATGLNVTGNGTGIGAITTGGSSSAAGSYSVGGAPNGVGSQAAGSGTASGVVGTGGSSSGIGVQGTGGPGGAGGYFTSGTASTITTRQSALQVISGDLGFSVANPSSTVAFTNVLTPKLAAKAWGMVRITGTGGVAVAVLDGVNVASAVIGCANRCITVTLASGTFTNAAVMTSGTCNQSGHISCIFDASPITTASSTFTIQPYVTNLNNTIDMSTNPSLVYISFLLYGAQ